jgi:hypothetical protein
MKRVGWKSLMPALVPGVVVLGLMIALMAYRRPWPAQAPVHFDLHWNSDRMGSPWEAGIFPVLVALILCSEIGVTVLWMRHDEGPKRFNLVLPLMSLSLGAIAGLHLWYWWNLSELAETGHAKHPWVWLFASAGAVMVAAIVLERVRQKSSTA